MEKLVEVNQVDVGSLKSEEWYQNLIDDCKTIITERRFNACWEVIQCKWEIGDFKRVKIYGKKIVQGLAESLKVSERDVWYCIQFRKKYPDLNNLPEGKAISWTKIVNEYLPKQKEQSEVIPLPKGKFDIILADCPWRYDFSIDDKDKIEQHYPTMDLEDIKKMELPANDDAVLFLWATAPKLLEALEVMKAWGFEYKSNAIWDKEWIGMGYWFRGQHELLLIGVRGSFSPPESDKRVSSVYREKRTEHSRKPEYFYELIEDMFPTGKYLELFARRRRPKWESYGNEVKQFRD